MEVRINGYEINVSLEKEKTAKDVVLSILEWTRTRDMIFTELLVDGEPYGIDDCPETDISEVKVIDCIVQSKGDLIIGTMNEGVAYCEKIITYAEAAVSAGKSDLKEKEFLVKGSSWLVESIRSIFQLLSMHPDQIRYLDHPVSYYLDALDRSGKELALINDENKFVEFLSAKKELFEIVKAIIKMLFLSENLRETIVKGLESPTDLVKGLSHVKNEIGTQMENLTKIAEFFQSGHDAEGADLLQTFIDFIYRYTRVCGQISPVFGVDLSTIELNGSSLEQINSTIQSHLEEIVTVMENNDIISLSDILEYQMRGEVEICGKYIDLLLEKIAG